jgi:cytochrome P450
MSCPSSALSFAALPVAHDRAAAYRRLHEHGPVGRLENGGFVVTGRSEVEHVLRHPELFSSSMAFAGIGSPFPMVPIEFDPPQHTRYRRILQPHFGPRAMRTLREQVSTLARELVERVAGTGRCDFTPDVAEPLPADVLLELFALPRADRDRLIRWKAGLSGPGVVNGDKQPSADAAESSAELHAYLVSHVGRIGALPDGGVLTELLAGADGERLTEEELFGMLFQFVLAGLDTVTSALSNAFTILASRPDLQRRIGADPSTVPALVEELLRLDGPVFAVPRVSVEETRLAGVTIPRGAPVFVALAATNRDPLVYRNPGDMSLDRERPHVAFGAGPHRCIGSRIAQMEMQAVVAEWHRLIPRYGIASGTDPEVPWPNGLVGTKSLVLEFDSRG